MASRTSCCRRTQRHEISVGGALRGVWSASGFAFLDPPVVSLILNAAPSAPEDGKQKRSTEPRLENKPTTNSQTAAALAALPSVVRRVGFYFLQ